MLTVLTFVLLSACSKGNDKAATIDPVTGKHPERWVVTGTGGSHPAAFIAGPSACPECHGMALDGGISNVSCFSTSRNGINCHPNGPSGHPAGWSSPGSHGAAAKATSSGTNGFAHCQVCHGSTFSGGIARSCLNTAGCHGAGIMAPHAARPWLSKIGGRTHGDTDASNAAACNPCHSGGANSGRKPSTTPPAGTAPGCFNNTLCHGVEGHNTGWAAPEAHGIAALSPAGGNKGFSTCTVCHGTRYDGSIAEQSCITTSGCHGARSPHPAKPWRSATGGVSHTRVDSSNAGACTACHTGGANSSRIPRPGDPVGATGCFNNTLCHGTVGHAAGWNDPAQHGAEAKKSPTATTGFSACQACHGGGFTNGPAVTCFNTAVCHGSGVNAPHAKKPWFSRTGGPTHTSTDAGNVGTCSICHTAGANSTIKPPAPATGTPAGCYNNTLCHFHQIPYAPSATISASLHGGEAKKDLTICQACHGTSGTTAFDGVTLADDSKTIGCSTCHPFAKAHPTDWQGSGPYSHRTAGNRSNACALCHDVSQGRTAPLPAAPSCFRTSYTNGAGQARTCHASGPGVAPHGVPYSNHNATARSNFSYCLGCHPIGPNVTGGIPGCMTCHLLDPQVNATNCVSCHSQPPNGTVYPNIGRSHASHSVLNVADSCAECHSGLGRGTSDHLERARLRTTVVQANPVVFGPLAKTELLVPAFATNTGSCANTYCHGASLTGGGTNKAPLWGQAGYLTAAGCGTCHGFPPTTVRRGAATHSSSTTCSTCHANVSATNNGFTSTGRSLHINGIVEASAGAAHSFPYPGASHAIAGATIANCSGCHNTTSAGSFPVPAGTAPNCRACHISSLGVGCTDCHGSPPTGTAAPNTASSHAVHMKANVNCATCHTGAGSGTSLHGYGTTVVSIPTLYQAQTGGATSYSGGTCRNVSCHGGQTTPIWGTTGSIPSDNAGCGLCHQYNVLQYNSFRSGRHNKHVIEEQLLCTRCHDLTRMTNHFSGLNTSTMNRTDAINSLRTSLNYTSGSPSCDANTVGGCHARSEGNW